MLLFHVLSLTDDVVQKLRKQYKIKLPDAIIAATALVYDLTLVTRNISDFQKSEPGLCECSRAGIVKVAYHFFSL
ncbi:MAG: PIN domain-containing protein [Saprospiraceae bacterium]|nr:PIN domain-containing protein [Saprospiraceae bacterium]